MRSRGRCCQVSKRTIDLVYKEDFLKSHRDSPWGTTQREQKEGLEFNFEEYKNRQILQI